ASAAALVRTRMGMRGRHRRKYFRVVVRKAVERGSRTSSCTRTGRRATCGSESSFAYVVWTTKKPTRRSSVAARPSRHRRGQLRKKIPIERRVKRNHFFRSQAEALIPWAKQAPNSPFRGK